MVLYGVVDVVPVYKTWVEGLLAVRLLMVLIFPERVPK